MRRLSSDTAGVGRAAIAVIGIGCRFAGEADGPEAFWQMLAEGRNGVASVPADRWDTALWYHPDRHHPGTMNMRAAGFLRQDIAAFDPGYFGIAPREAQSMDPQQRLFLEVAHEALEDAGIPADQLANSRTGVFAGVYNAHYTLAARGAPDPDLINGWSATGGPARVVAGRLSYILGRRGPALVVDTACSSSLVAVHLAIRSLRSGESRVALAGGVHLLTSPEPLVASTKLGATAPDGRCKAFDSSADGFGHGEGAGVVVLKRLDDAMAEGDRIIAVIRGSAVNQDGRSNSLTAPNGQAQRDVIAEALADAGMSAADIGFVEAHGTGTPLGDPIEVEAIAAALKPAADRPVMIGSVKANIGHTEAAAGIAGLIKAILAVERGVVPPQVAFSSLNPEIAALEAAIEIPLAPVPLAARNGRVSAGVSAFGFAGTNAHVIVEAHAREPDAIDTARTRVVAVSGRSEAALRQSMTRWADALEKAPEGFAALAFTATAGRAAASHRVAVVAADARTAAASLRRAVPQAVTRPPRVAFVFTGQGSQHAGMCRELYAAHPVFRAALDSFLTVLDGELGTDSKALLFGTGSIDRTGLAQPLLVAVELALASFWRHLGVEPVAVMGHSVGEIAAAAVSGAMTAEDAVRFAAARGRIMEGLPEGGGMLAVFADAHAVSSHLGRAGGILSIAAINAAGSTVVAGEIVALDRLAERLEAEGIDCRKLSVSHAFHSPLIASALPALREAASVLPCKPPTVPLVSNLTGEAVARLGAEHWLEHALRPVRFADGLKSLAALDIDTVLEIGPDAVLTGLVKMNGAAFACIPSLRRGRKDDAVIAEAAAALFVAGVRLDWRAFHDGERLIPARAPLTPFERGRHWLDVPSPARHESLPQPPSQENRPEPERGTALVYDFYDELTVVSRNYSNDAGRDIAEEGHLTFGFLPEPDPSFSWVRALFDRDTDPAGHLRLRQTQRALKDVLFADIDFARIGTVFDYGCGHAADLASMALAHPHIVGRGFTLSAGQVEVGRRRLADMGLSGRVTVDRADSSKVAFPVAADLVFGVEVTGLIADKDGLFANVAASLKPGGVLVIADFLATQEAIANPETHSFTPTAAEWAGLLGRHRLRLVSAVDGSRAVANWLDDPAFDANVDRLVADYGLSDLTRRHLLSNGNIGRALRADIMRYLLLRAVASPHETVEAVTAANLAALHSARPASVPSPAPSPASWLYRIEMRPSPIRPVLDPRAIRQAMAGAIERETAALAALPDLGAVMDALSRDLVAHALHELGAADLSAVPGLPIEPQHRRLAAHLAGELTAAGITVGERPGLADGLAAARARYPQADAELTLLERCGPRLADVFRGTCDPLELLFPGGDTALVEALYARSPLSAGLQRLAGAVASSLPVGQPLAMIEIGGGTGSTTANLLPHLAKGSSYLFTDISPSLVNRALGRFSGAGLEAAVFDVERPAGAQDIAVGCFDVAIASNVLHATRDLDAALANVASLLGPGGMLMMVENAGSFLWGDITFGLTPGMWAFAETPERRHALLSPDAWRAHLTRAGFEDVEIIDPGHAGLNGISRQCLILARKELRRRIAIVGEDSRVTGLLAEMLATRGHAAIASDRLESVPSGLTDLVLADGLAGDSTAPDHLASIHAQVRDAAEAETTPAITMLAAGTADAAALEGFARGVAGELPETRCRSIVIDGQTPGHDDLVRIAAAFESHPGDVRLGRDSATAPRLVAAPAGVLKRPEFNPAGSYIVTGAFGGLGPRLARWLSEHGAGHLVLAARRLPGPDARQLLDGLDAQIEICDVSDGDAVARLVDRANAIAPLRGIFHAAGALADGALLHQSADAMRLPLKSKLHGAQHLDRCTAGLAIDHFVLFSSAAGLLAPRGQANHAAANTALDRLAHLRRARGLPALSVDWGAFAEVGAAMRPGIEDKVADSGLGFMGVDDAFDALGHAMVTGETQVAILSADWQLYGRRYPRGGVPYLLQELCRQSSRKTPAATTPASPSPQVRTQDWRERLGLLPASHRLDALSDLIRSVAAPILGLPEMDIDDHRPLRDMGLDSLMAIELRNALSRELAARLGATLVFDHPTVHALAGHFSGTVLSDQFIAASDTANAAADDLAMLDAEALSQLLAAELEEIAGTG